MIMRHLLIWACLLVCLGQRGSRLTAQYEKENSELQSEDIQVDDDRSFQDASVEVQEEGDANLNVAGDIPVADKEDNDILEETVEQGDADVSLPVNEGEDEIEEETPVAEAKGTDELSDVGIEDEENSAYAVEKNDIDIERNVGDDAMKESPEEPVGEDLADSELSEPESNESESEVVQNQDVDSNVLEEDLGEELIDEADFLDDELETLDDELTEWDEDLFDEVALGDVGGKKRGKSKSKRKKKFADIDFEDVYGEDDGLSPHAKVLDGFASEDEWNLEDLEFGGDSVDAKFGAEDWEWDDELDTEKLDIDMQNWDEDEFDGWSIGDLERELEKGLEDSEEWEEEDEEEFGEEEEDDDGYFMYDFEDDAYVFPQNMDGSHSLKGTIQLQAEVKYEQQVCNFGPEVAFLRIVANRTEDVKKKAIYKGLAWGLQFSSIESNMLSGIYSDMLLQTWEIMQDNKDNNLRIVFHSVCQKLADFTENNLKALFPLDEENVTDGWGLLTAVSVFHECNINLDYFYGFFMNHMTKDEMKLWERRKLLKLIKKGDFDSLSDYVIDLGHYMMTKNLPSRWQRWIPKMEWDIVYEGLGLLFEEEWTGDDLTNAHYLAAHLLISLTGHDLDFVPANRITGLVTRYVQDNFNKVVRESFTHTGCWTASNETLSYWVEEEGLGLKKCHKACSGFEFFGYFDEKFCFCGTEEDDYESLGLAEDCKDGYGSETSMDVYERKISKSFN